MNNKFTKSIERKLVNTMYSALIVEDELFALHSMRAALDWEAAGINQVYESANGQEAYKLYLRKRPNIILTDLNMPVMDGITLIRNIREKEADAKTRFIIMSCLDEFHLVQQALNMGVSHYFLKATTSCRDIQTILRNITQELEEEKQKSRRNVNIAEKAMQNLADGYSLPPEEAANALSAAGISPNEQYAILLLYLSRSKQGKNAILPDSAIINQEIMECSGEPAEILRISASRCVVLLKKEAANRLNSLLPRLCAKLSVNTTSGLQAGMSGLQLGPENLADAMRQAQYALDICYFNGSSSALYTGQKSNSLPEDISIRLLSLPDTFLHLPGKFLDSYEIRMRQIISQSYSDSASFKKALSAIVIWLSMQTDSIRDSLEDNCVGYTHQISESKTLQESIECFEQFATDILSLSSFSQQMPAVVKEALLYIHSNLDHPLTLNELAEHTHLNPSYLSTLFHRVMRQSPISYVNSVRIERARILLRSTDWSISQIASSLGFSQDIYFYRLFKRLTHETPSEYRMTNRQLKTTVPENSEADFDY